MKASSQRATRSRSPGMAIRIRPGTGVGGVTAVSRKIRSEVVSLTGVGSQTPNGVRIGPVYTPPEARNHGYASALVAAASQAQLDDGRRFCFLFTDLANPTANHIYQTIGYEPVRDVDMWRHDRA